MRFGYEHFIRASPGPRLVRQPAQSVTPDKPKARGRTLAEFHPLKRAEQRLLDACRKGEQAQVGNSRPRKRDERKILRAGFVRFLALGGDDTAPLHERGVNLRGAWIVGSLDLTGCKVPHPFRLVSCVIDTSVILIGAETKSLYFDNCKIGVAGGEAHVAIRANLLECLGGLYLVRGFRALGQVNLIAAHVRGDLVFEGGQFVNRKGIAIFADGAQIDNRVFFRRTTASKTVMTEKKKPFRRTTKLEPRFVAHGTISFNRAAIKNGANFSNGIFLGAEGSALNFEDAEIGTVYLRNVFVHGTAGFTTARVRGNFDCNGSTFVRREGVAIHCDGVTVGGVVLLRKLTVFGEIRFHSATIGNLFECAETRFRQEPQERALTCNNLTVGGTFEFRRIQGPDNLKRFSIVAMLEGRQFGRLLNLLWRGPRSELRNDLHDCWVTLRRWRVREILDSIRSGATRELIDDLAGRRRAGIVYLTQARATTFTDDMSSWRATASMELDGFQYERISSAVNARLRIRWLRHQIPTHLRTDFRPQPWEQLAHVLSDMGHVEDAKQVRIRARILARRSLWLHRQPWLKMPYWYLRTRFDKLLGLLVGYGYRPWRTPLFLLGVWALGAWIYMAVESSGIMAPLDGKIARSETVPRECKIDWVNFTGPMLPTSQKIEDDWRRGELEASRRGPQAPRSTWHDICRRAIPLEYSDFHPFLYSADLMVPFLDLKQRNNWRVRPANDDTVELPSRTVVRPPFFEAREVETRWLRDRLEYWQFIQPILGWALLLLIAGTVSGLIKKD